MIYSQVLLGKFQITDYNKAFLVLSFTILSVECSALTSDERLVCTRGLICMVKKETLDFFVVGDTGGKFKKDNLVQTSPLGVPLGKKHSKSADQSKPTETQLGVATSMVHLATQQPIDFVINVGDNIYKNGAKSVNDTNFKVNFIVRSI